jgi:hypothetical protein
MALSAVPVTRTQRPVSPAISGVRSCIAHSRQAAKAPRPGSYQRIDGNPGQNSGWQKQKRREQGHGGSPSNPVSTGDTRPFELENSHIIIISVLYSRTMTQRTQHHLRLFRAVAHDGTLTDATCAPNLSQSALSTRITALEADRGRAPRRDHRDIARRHAGAALSRSAAG